MLHPDQFQVNCNSECARQSRQIEENWKWCVGKALICDEVQRLQQRLMIWLHEKWESTYHYLRKRKDWKAIILQLKINNFLSEKINQRWERIFVTLNDWQGFPGGSDGKASACNAWDPGSIPGSGRPPGEGNGNPLQHSCLENPMDRGAWQATVHGVTKSRTRLNDFTFTFSDWQRGTSWI